MNGEAAAATWFRLDQQFATMAVENVLADGEAQTSATFGAAVFGTHAIEPLRQTWHMMGSNTRTIVFNCKLNITLANATGDANALAVP